MLGDREVLVNRRRDGTLEIRGDVNLHGGTGETLEMREFGISALRSKLEASGFREAHLLSCNIPEFGILFDHDVSQPLIARKEPFALDQNMTREMLNLWRVQGAQLGMASQSRWVKLGRTLGVGPKF
jgi:hypothetical protein